MKITNIQLYSKNLKNKLRIINQQRYRVKWATKINTLVTVETQESLTRSFKFGQLMSIDQI